MRTLALGLILGSVLGGFLFLLRRRSSRGATEARDAPAVLLGWAIGFLAPDRAEWGEAMVGELAGLREGPQRWRFALGCLTAALLVPPRRGDSGRLVVSLVAVAAAACAGVVAYGLVRYPGLLSAGGTWPTLVFFGAVLAGLALMAAIIVRRGASGAAGLIGGLAVAGVWALVAVVVVTHSAKPVFPLLLLALVLASLAVGAAGTWHGGSGSAGRRTALVASVVAGLTLFLVLAAVTLATAGGPYDAGQIRDFPTSGLPDMATYAVSDNLGSAMALLLLVSVLTGAIGCVGASLATRLRPVGPRS